MIEGSFKNVLGRGKSLEKCVGREYIYLFIFQCEFRSVNSRVCAANEAISL